MQAKNTKPTNTPVVPPVVPPLSLLQQLQASAPASVSNAQLSALITQVQGAYAPNANGVQVPQRGVHCVNVWVAVLTHCIANNQVPNLQQVQAVLPLVHPTTVSIQRAKCLRYLGITK